MMPSSIPTGDIHQKFVNSLPDRISRIHDISTVNGGDAKAECGPAVVAHQRGWRVLIFPGDLHKILEIDQVSIIIAPHQKLSEVVHPGEFTGWIDSNVVIIHRKASGIRCEVLTVQGTEYFLHPDTEFRHA